MRVKSTTRFALFALFALASTLFAGCSAATTSSPQPLLAPASIGASAQSADTARAVSAGLSAAQSSSAGEILVADNAAQQVKIFGLGGKLLGAIPGFTDPTSLAADTSGDLYVTNGTAGNTLVFASDHKTLIATLLDPGRVTYGIAVHSVSGLVAVVSTTPHAGQSSIEFYLKGKTTPCRNISSPRFNSISNVGFDAQGNLYVAGLNDTKNAIIPVIGVVPGPGCAATGITNLAFAIPNQFFEPADVKVTPSGNIAVLDFSDFPQSIYTYAPPVNGSLGAPIATTVLNNTILPGAFALSDDGAFAYVADTYVHNVQVYAYPAGGAAVQTVGFHLMPFGVVVTPIWR